MRIAPFIVSCCWLVSAFASATRAEGPPELWVYAGVNFQVDESTDELLTLLERAKKAGYSAAVVTDYKFGKIEDRPERYYVNLRRARETAARLGVELIPCVTPVGYSNSILQNNPNLAAGIPVKDCDFVVGDDGTAAAISENLLPGGGFEEAGKNAPADWDWIDGFGVSTALDTDVRHAGKSSLRMRDFAKGNETGNCRVVKKLRLKPHHQYRVSLWAKTQDWSGGEFNITPLAEGKTLNHATAGVQGTQDWTRHTIVFNSLEHEEVSLYLGLWGGGQGTLWLDDVRCEIAAGVNLLRREGCPVRVTGEDGQSFEEGRDFEPWSDPKMGNDPYLGEYSDDHEPPPLRLASGSRIKPGQRLKVSYYHTSIIYDGQVCSSLLHNELFEHMARQVRQIDEHLKPARYFMQHDEIRLAGRDELEQSRPTGESLAENARRCVKLIRDVNPKAGIMVWSDMFDPHHNAVESYYLCRGTLRGAWEGLPPDVGIVNWNGGRAADSLKFFAERGHKQIVAGYYDADVAANVKSWRSAAAGVKGVEAYLYTTWRGDYSQLERFAELVRE